MAEDQTQGKRFSLQSGGRLGARIGDQGSTQTQGSTQSTGVSDTSGVQSSGVFLPGITNSKSGAGSTVGYSGNREKLQYIMGNQMDAMQYEGTLKEGNQIQEVQAPKGKVELPGITYTSEAENNKKIDEAYKKARAEDIQVQFLNAMERNKQYGDQVNSEIGTQFEQGARQRWNNVKKAGKGAQSLLLERMAQIGYVNGAFGAMGTDEAKKKSDEWINDARNSNLEYKKKINEGFKKWQKENVNQDMVKEYNGRTFSELITRGDMAGVKYKTIGLFADNISLLPNIVVTAINTPAGLTLMGSDTFIQESQNGFDEMIENGASYEEARNGAMWIGALNAGIEMAGEELFGIVGPASRGLRRLFMKNAVKEIEKNVTKKTLPEIILRAGGAQLKSALGEGGEEVLQEIVTNAFVNTVNKDRSLLDNLWQSFEGGAVMGLLIPGGALNSVTTDVQNNKIIDQKTDLEALDYVLQGEQRKAQRIEQQKEKMRQRANAIKNPTLDNGYTPTQEEAEQRAKENEEREQFEQERDDEYNREMQIENDMMNEVLSEGDLNEDLGDPRYQKKEISATDESEDSSSLADQSPASRVNISPENSSEISKNLNEIKKNLEDLKTDTFLQQIKKSITGNEKGSNYIINKIDGKKYVLRIADHSANGYQFDNSKQRRRNTSIVIKLAQKSKFKKSKNVDLVEFVYNPENMTTEKMQGIIDGIQNWIKTGEYTDTNYDSKNQSTRKRGENKKSETEEKYQLKYEEEGYTPGVAGKNEKNISGKEGVNLRNKLNKKTVKELAEKYGIKVEVIEGMIEILEKGKKKGYAYGKYIDQLLTLSEQIKESTAPHELLHAIFDMIDPETKTYLISQVMKSEGWSASKAEERLADSFSNFFRTGKIEGAPKSTWGKIKIFFKRVRSFINGMGKWRNQLEGIFTDIIESEGIEDLQGKIDRNERINKAKERMRERFKQYQKNAEKMQKKADKSKEKYQTVYHGSPYDFEKFDSANMGKGEGAQAHGWGHYVAVEESTGRHYAELKGRMGNAEYKGKSLNDLYRDMRSPEGEEYTLAMDVLTAHKDYNLPISEAIKKSKEYYENEIKKYEDFLKDEGLSEMHKTYRSIIEKYKKKIDIIDNMKESDFTGTDRNLYEVEIPDPVKADTPTGSNYLEEDGKITRPQLDKIVKALESYIPEKEIERGEDLPFSKEVTQGLATARQRYAMRQLKEWGLSGDETYKALSTVLGGDKQASKFLESLGYDGIHYFGGRDGEAYVIFNDDALEIKNHEKYQKMEDEYKESVEKGDTKRAKAILREYAKEKGYDSSTDYQGSLAFNGSAPSSEGYTKAERIDPETEIYSQTLGDYASDGVDIGDLDWQLTDRGNYIRGDEYVRESIDNLNKAVREYKNGNKNAKIRMYRAIDANIKEEKFRNGDWITPSKKYAEMHIGLQNWDNGRIISEEVPIENIRWDNNDINEWGYDDEKEYGYKNTPNNRKELEITYDDNGNLIPLSERFNENVEDERYQKAGDIESESFKKRFGDSKVVDENGNPLVVYHGTQNKFNTFKKMPGGRGALAIFGDGFYFAESKKRAGEFKKERAKNLWDLVFGGRIMEVYLSIQNPYEVTYSRDLVMPSMEELMKKGYDGVKADTGEEIYWIAFKPNQIKSATDNVGTYDPNNEDIRYQVTEYEYDENGNPKWIKFGEDNEFDPSIFGENTKEEQIEEDKENEKENPFYNAWMKYNNQNYKDDQITLAEFMDAIGKWGEKQQEEYDQKMRDIAEAENDPKMLELQLKAIKLMEKEQNVGKKFGKNVSKEVRDKQQKEVEKEREELVKEIFDWMYPGLKFEDATYDDMKMADEKEAEWEMLGRGNIEEKLKFFKKDKNGNWEKKNIKIENPNEKLDKIIKSGNFDEIFEPTDRVIEWKTPEGQKGRIDKAKDPKKFKSVMEKINSGKTKTKVDLKDVTNEVRALERYKENEKAEKERRKKEKQEEFAKKKQEEYKRMVRMKAFQRLVDMQRFEKYPFLTEEEIKNRYGFSDQEWKTITEQEEIKLPKKWGEKAISDFNKAVDDQVKYLIEGLNWQNNMKMREAEKNLGEIGEIDLDVLLGKDEEKGAREVEEFEKLAKEGKEETGGEKIEEGKTAWEKDMDKKNEKAKKQAEKLTKKWKDDVNDMFRKAEEKRNERYANKEEKVIDEVKTVEEAKEITKESRWKRTKKFWKDTTIQDLIQPISSRIEKISPRIYLELMRFEQRVAVKTNTRMKQVEDFVKKMSEIRSKNKKDYLNITLHLLNGNVGTANKMLEKYGTSIPRQVLDEIWADAEDVGYTMNYEGFYYPRKVKDVQDFLDRFAKTENKDIQGEIDKIVKKKEEQARKRGEEFTPQMKADLINQLLMEGEVEGISLGSGHMKQRKVDSITKNMLEFYEDPVDALLQYITSMTEAVEKARFLGQGTRGEIKTLGEFITDEGITGSDVDELKDLLLSRFNYAPMGNFMRGLKVSANIIHLGSPSSALSQLADISFSLIENGLTNLVQGLANRYNLDLDALGITNRGEELKTQGKNETKREKVQRFTFKWTGFNMMDQFGKKSFVVSTLNKLIKYAKRNDPQLRKDLERWFDDPKMINEIIEDLKEGRMSENVNLFLFTKLADVQPLTRTQMPKTYLQAGNWRVLYAFKTFGIKQLDYLIQTSKRELATKSTAKALWTITAMLGIIMLCGAGTDEIKDFTLGRKSSSWIWRMIEGNDWSVSQMSDRFWDNLLKLVGMTKYSIYQARTQGIKSAIEDIFFSLPGLDIVTYPLQDIQEAMSEDGLDFSQASSWQLLPIVGKYGYWWAGAGQTKQQKALDKEKKKAEKENSKTKTKKKTKKKMTKKSN